MENLELQLFVDTETTDIVEFKQPYSSAFQPDTIQLAAILSTVDYIFAEVKLLLVPPSEDWGIAQGAADTHGITKLHVATGGVPTRSAMGVLAGLLARSKTLVCHNVSFDIKMLMIALHRTNGSKTLGALQSVDTYCTMQRSVDLVKIPFEKGGSGYKWPKLSELHHFLFGEGFEGAHDAMADVRAARRCYYEMRRRGL